MARVELQEVSKSFGPGAAAVDRVSLSLYDGEILALLGPSGCGKTTTLRLIAGFEWPDHGRILIDGRVVAGDGHWVSPERRGVGMVFQDYPLFPHRTVRQNVAFGLHRLSKKEAARRVDELLEQVGLTPYADRYPHQLSGGQQQRVAIAQALAPRPSVILLDEPFSNLDAALRQELRLQVRELLKANRTSAILVSHDQKEAFTLADRIAVMRQGRIEQIGMAYELYSRPRTRFVAEFLGHTAVLEGVFQEEKKGVLTDLGVVPCAGALAASGEHVTVSLRPDSLVVDPHGPFRGAVESVVHEGDRVELAVRLPCGAGSITLRTYAPPDLVVRPGDTLAFAIVPDRVAVIS